MIISVKSIFVKGFWIYRCGRLSLLREAGNPHPEVRMPRREDVVVYISKYFE
ncbi:hypothetical protein AB1303_15840 [Saccharolobus solfataricus]